jgi:hypothetical protein
MHSALYGTGFKFLDLWVIKQKTTNKKEKLGHFHNELPYKNPISVS